MSEKKEYKEYNQCAKGEITFDAYIKKDAGEMIGGDKPRLTLWVAVRNATEALKAACTNPELIVPTKNEKYGTELVDLNITLWGKRAEGLQRFLKKGATVCVTGRFSTFKKKDGTLGLSFSASNAELISYANQDPEKNWAFPRHDSFAGVGPIGLTARVARDCISNEEIDDNREVTFPVVVSNATRKIESAVGENLAGLIKSEKAGDSEVVKLKVATTGKIFKSLGELKGRTKLQLVGDFENRNGALVFVATSGCARYFAAAEKAETPEEEKPYVETASATAPKLVETYKYEEDVPF